MKRVLITLVAAAFIGGCCSGDKKSSCGKKVSCSKGNNIDSCTSATYKSVCSKSKKKCCGTEACKAKKSACKKAKSACPMTAKAKKCPTGCKCAKCLAKKAAQ